MKGSPCIYTLVLGDDKLNYSLKGFFGGAQYGARRINGLKDEALVKGYG